MERINMDHILGIILAGGQGTRLEPLTQNRSKPAVHLAGKYRIVDFPITNCIHSGVGKIFVLTQFHSASLNQHITQTYKFDMFHDSFVDIIASEASKDLSNFGFSQGTADAVRKGMKHLNNVRNVTHGLILAGDQLYKMNFRKLRDIHSKHHADLTLGVVAVPRSEAGDFGIIKIDEQQQVLDFWEKPGNTKLSPDWYVPEKLRQQYNIPENYVFASMSMYFIKLSLLDQILMEKHHMMDFGKEIIPYIINSSEYKTHVAIHHGYWEDIGTLANFHKANIDLAQDTIGFNIYDPNWKILTKPSLLPPSYFKNTKIVSSIIGDGCYIDGSSITNSIIGQRYRIESGTSITNSVIMGADWTETEFDKQENIENNIPNIGIGKNCIIEGAIIDKNARIGNNVVLMNKNNIQDCVSEHYIIKDGILIIPAKSIIPSNFTISI